MLVAAARQALVTREHVAHVEFVTTDNFELELNWRSDWLEQSCGSRVFEAELVREMVEDSS